MLAKDGPREVPRDPGQRDAIVAQLDDSAVLSIAALRSGSRVRISGALERFDAVIIEERATEFRGFGTPATVAELMRTIDDWGCVEVEPEDAPAVAARLSSSGGLPSKFYGSVYYELRTPVRRRHHDAVRPLGTDDLNLIHRSDPSLFIDASPRTLQEELVAGAVIGGLLVARASCLARSNAYADIGVATLTPFQGRGLATAAASIVAARLQQSHLVPVWSTGETNWASQRIAEKLGFAISARRTYVIPIRRPDPPNQRP